MNDKCIECGVTENDVQYFDGRMDRPRPVKLTKSRYGLLCQRHVKNAYARQMTTKKRTKRQQEKHEVLLAAGQMDMFAGLEGEQ